VAAQGASETGDLRDDLRGRLSALVAEVPAGATPAVFHSAALAYLTADDRAAAAAAITGTGARWISFEGRDVVTPVREPPGPVTRETSFIAALDRVPLALADGHGGTMTLLGA
jgi:hypothetical protein